VYVQQNLSESDLGGYHEESLDADVSGVGRACEVVASQSGAVEHVRDAVVAQNVQIVGVALTADEDVIQQLGRVQLGADERRRRRAEVRDAVG